MKRTDLMCTLLLLLTISLGCQESTPLENNQSDTPTTDTTEVDTTPEDSTVVDDADLYPDWNDNTHSKNVDPNFDIVFAQNVVMRVDLTISSENWAAMWDDLEENIGSSQGPGGGGPGPGGGGNAVDVDFDPIWAPCNFKHNDINWYNVGVRFKGNSSLITPYQSGNEKLSLKFDFDEFEDDYPELKNQRFHGFKQLNFANNYNDQSLLREKVTSDLYRQFGIAAAHTAFAAVYIDYGNGPEYFGVYTIVEEVDDTVIETQFNDDSGNLYKPEDDAATFKSGSYNESEFNKKTNEDEGDYSDVLALYDALHDDSRTNDTQAWKTLLENALDVDHFFKWLAANLTMQNWDTYGNMSHNYYIYTNPDTQLITWIPWDNNESLQSGNSSIEVSALHSVSSQWPLISYLIDVDEYEEIYKGYLREFIDTVFIPSEITAKYDSYYTLLKEYAYAEENGRTFINSNSSFDSAISTLKTHVSSRNNVVNNYLGDF